MMKIGAETAREKDDANSTLPASELAGMNISFKLDQRLTRSMYMGDRWVSPPTYTKVQEGENLIVEARVNAFDDQGREIGIVPIWEAGDTSIITVMPKKGKQVKLIVLKEGQSAVTVSFGNISRKLSVSVRLHKEVLIVDITS